MLIGCSRQAATTALIPAPSQGASRAVAHPAVDQRIAALSQTQRRLLSIDDSYNVTLKKGQVYRFDHAKFVQRKINNKKTRDVLAVRGKGYEWQHDLADISSVSKVNGKGAVPLSFGTTRTSESLYCDEADPDCGQSGVDGGPCDPAVQICCPDGLSGTILYWCGSTIYFGAEACYLDVPCGDDGNGNLVGVQLIITPSGDAYCWYDFVLDLPNCFFAAGYNGGRPGKDLFLFNNYLVTQYSIVCRGPVDLGGRLFAFYTDPNTAGVATSSYEPLILKIISYPTDFPNPAGNLPPTLPVNIQSNWFSFGISLPPFYSGYCNSRYASAGGN
jgi:hypothetical protein